MGSDKESVGFEKIVLEMIGVWIRLRIRDLKSAYVYMLFKTRHFFITGFI